MIYHSLIMSWCSLVIVIAISLILCPMILQVNCACLNCFGLVEDEEFDISGIEGNEIKDEYNRLDEYLRNKSPETCSLETSLKELSKQYKKDYLKLFFTKPKTLKAYKLFLSLHDLSKPSKCNGEALEIIEKNLAALDNKPALENKGLYKLRCIDEIFLNILKQHANICSDVYHITFDEKLRTIDKEKAESVSKFVDEGITKFSSLSANKSLVQRLFFLVDCEPDFRPAYIYSFLQEMLRGKPEERFLIPIIDEETGKILLNKHKFEQLFEEYLLEPCKYFEKHFGADLFELTSHEIQYHKVYEDNENFYRNWVRYRICANFNKDAKEKMEETFRFVAYSPKAYITALS